MIIADDEKVLQERAAANAKDAHAVTRKRFLDTQNERPQNLVCRPAVLPKGIYRRAPPRSALATRTRQAGQYQLEARRDRVQIEFGLGDDHHTKKLAKQFAKRGYPYPLQDTIKVLGAQSDSHMTLDDHFRAL